MIRDSSAQIVVLEVIQKQIEKFYPDRLLLLLAAMNHLEINVSVD